MAWTADELWAAIIVRLLNETAHSGVAVVAGMVIRPKRLVVAAGIDNRLEAFRMKGKRNEHRDRL